MMVAVRGADTLDRAALNEEICNRGPGEEGGSLGAGELETQLHERAPCLRVGSAAEGAEVLGPVAAFVGKVKGFWRVHTHLKVPRSVPAAALAGAVRAATAEIGTPPKGHRINIDVDPVGLY